MSAARVNSGRDVTTTATKIRRWEIVEFPFAVFEDFRVN